VTTIFLSIAALVVGLVLLELGADRFTNAVGALARRLLASENVVGLLTAGGEWEELLVVVLAISSGHPGLAVGNVIGSCLANLIGSMPLGFLGPRPLVPDRSARIYATIMLLVTALAALLMIDGRVEPIGGGVLVAVFIGYVVSVLLVLKRGWLRPLVEDGDDDVDDALPITSLPRLIGLLIFSLAVIAGGAELVVQGAITIAERIGLSEYAIGATVVALGTTLPDKAISFIGGRRGQSGIVTANATGSNIFVLTLVLGLAALFSSGGLVIASSVIQIDLPLLIAASVFTVMIFRRASIHRRVGVFMLVLYIAYLAFALVRGI